MNAVIWKPDTSSDEALRAEIINLSITIPALLDDGAILVEEVSSE